MKKLALFVLVLITISFVSQNRAAIGEDFKTDCVVKKAWLNLDYDNKVDYKNPDIPTDFFMLVYSHSPSFCKYKKKIDKLNEVPFQCKSPNKFGWVIHGLWGESESAYIKGWNKRHPRFCKGDLKKLSLETLTPFLCTSPSTRLLQGEWEKHGSCDFDTAEDYFNKMQELYRRFKVPPPHLKAKKAARWIKENNPELKYKRLNLTRHEFGICFTTDFDLMSCPNKE